MYPENQPKNIFSVIICLMRTRPPPQVSFFRGMSFCPLYSILTDTLSKSELKTEKTYKKNCRNIINRAQHFKSDYDRLKTKKMSYRYRIISKKCICKFLFNPIVDTLKLLLNCVPIKVRYKYN